MMGGALVTTEELFSSIKAGYANLSAKKCAHEINIVLHQGLLELSNALGAGEPSPLYKISYQCDLTEQFNKILYGRRDS
ncbi:hypothetical protein CCR75_006707 [Bremia lactucae]|uniref:Uncharacterized protein n=1 Tax=Bremia lactucae TaxID=4779 RepID=A0A976FFD9_BRELC|nr:hypothetical protein CCR75_006707 [Bremia lactucae]